MTEQAHGGCVREFTELRINENDTLEMVIEKSDEWLRREIEWLMLEKQHAELTLAINEDSRQAFGIFWMIEVLSRASGKNISNSNATKVICFN